MSVHTARRSDLEVLLAGDSPKDRMRRVRFETDGGSSA